MRRRLTFTTRLFLAVGVLTLMAMGRSARTTDRVNLNHWHTSDRSIRSFDVCISHGRLILATWWRPFGAHLPGFEQRTAPPTPVAFHTFDEPIDVRRQGRWFGFDWMNSWRYGQTLAMPIAAPLVVVSAMWLLGRVPSLLRRRRARHRRGRGHCPVCDYDLRFSPARCSECGHPEPPAEATPAACRWQVRLCIAAVLVIFAGVWFAHQRRQLAAVARRLDRDHPLYVAIQAYDIAALNRALDGGANVDAAECLHGMSPLQFAAMHENLSAIEILLARGVDVDAAKSQQLTPLQYAVVHPARMIASPSNLRPRPPHLPPYALFLPEDHRNVAYKRAPDPRPRHGVAAAALLLAHGADVNAQNGLSGDTALHLAVEFRNPQLIELFLLAGADLSLRDSLGRTALQDCKRECPELLPYFNLAPWRAPKPVPTPTPAQ